MLGIHLSSFTRVPNCKFTNNLLPALLHGQEVNKPTRYLIKTTRICVRSGDLHIAEFCLDYLNFGCFDAHLTDAEIRDFLRQRYYSFEDYAIAHWLDHVESSTAQLLPLETISLEHLAQRLEVFLGKHWSDSPLIPLVPSEPRFQSIRQWDFTDKLDTLAQLAHQRESNGNFLDIEVQLQRRRLIYEDIITNNNPYNEAFHSLLNTSGCFKCPRKYCDHFFDGFANKEYRDKHINQHERPFRCSFKECPYAELGYGTEKELKQHERKSHPSGHGSEWAFPTYKPKRNPTIFSACEKGDLATVQRLVREGADVNQKLRPSGWKTPLFFTFKNDHADVAKYLIEQGAKNKNNWGLIASWVARYASISVLRMLLEMEADPTRRIECAQGALNSARVYDWVNAIPLLLSYGVDINRKDLRRRSPLQLAKDQGKHAFAQALLEHGALDDTRPPTPVTPVSPRPGSSSPPSVHDYSD